MRGLEADTIGGFNGLVEKQRKEEGEDYARRGGNMGPYDEMFDLNGDGEIDPTEETMRQEFEDETDGLGIFGEGDPDYDPGRDSDWDI